MIAPCKGLQGDAAQSAANQARSTGADPFSIRIHVSVLGSFTCKHAFSHSAAELWNSLSIIVRDASCVVTFKSKLKTYLFPNV